jgi:hypothetical protein
MNNSVPPLCDRRAPGNPVGPRKPGAHLISTKEENGMAKIKGENTLVEILQIKQATATFYILGNSPLLMNRMPKKTKEWLLLPPKRTNRAGREAVLKHDPIAEYRDSIYQCRDESAPTLVHVPDGAFKAAMAQAAIDIPGATKAEIGRLVQQANQTVFIYGTPYLDMQIVRQAGINRAPDLRTRALFPQWACELKLIYYPNLIIERNVLNLLAAAGMITGIGDGRPEKGKKSNGQWEIVSADNKDYRSILKQGRKVQEAAMANPVASNFETEELLSWYQAEIIHRTDEGNQPKSKPKGRRNGEGPEVRA